MISLLCETIFHIDATMTVASIPDDNDMSQTLTDHDIISRLPRAPEKRSVAELLARLNTAGHQITARSLQRRLHSLTRSHPLQCDDRDKPFGWSILADGKVALGELSVQEAVALKLSERYLGEAMPADLLGDLKSYFSQADAKLKHESLYREWLEKIRVVPASQPMIKPVVARNIHANAYEGVLKRLALNVTYRGANAAKAKTYDIHPLAIVVRGSITYLIARFPWADDEDASLMALHRFTSIRLTGEKIEAGKFDLDTFIASGQMGFMPESENMVRVRFYENAGAHLVETPLSSSQKLKSSGEAEHELTVHLPITEQLKWWLFGFGDRAEVLAPQSLRAEFKTRLNSAGRRYRTPRKA